MSEGTELPGLRQRAIPIGALLLICLIWAGASLRSEMLPGSAAQVNLTPLLKEALLLALFAVLAEVAALARKAHMPRDRSLSAAILVGLGLFVVPAVLNNLGRGWIDDSTRVALYSLTPLFAVIFEPHLVLSSAPEPRGGFAAALVAVVGTLMVFPLELPRSAGSAFAFCGVLASAASVAAANCLGVRTIRRSGSSLLLFATISTGSAAICLGLLGALTRPGVTTVVPFDAWAVPDLIALALLFWLMRHMTAVRMTTRFLIAPLLANLVGLTFLRPHIPLLAWFGLLLIAVGSGWLLLAPGELPEANATILGID